MLKRIGITLFTSLFIVFVVPGLGRANVTDPDDIAKIAEIEGLTDAQLVALSDFQLLVDELLVNSEHELEEAEGLVEFTKALLEVDLANLLLDSCAESCAAWVKPARNPSDPRGPKKNCWECAHPRLMISTEHHGYLEDVLDMIERDIHQAEDRGLPVDVHLAEHLLEEARDAALAGATEEAFSRGCQAFHELSCFDKKREVVLEPHHLVSLLEKARAFAGEGDRPATDSNPMRSEGGSSKLLDPALDRLGRKVTAVSAQLSTVIGLVQLVLDKAEVIEEIGHEAEHGLEDARRRDLEQILLDCVDDPDDCIDPNLLTSVLDPRCQDFKDLGHGHAAPPTKDHVPEFDCLLREIIFTVHANLEAAEEQGLERDLELAEHELESAIDAHLDGDGRTSFRHACRSFSALACP